MTTYTVLNRDTGEVIDRGVDLAEAAHIVLTDDGRSYEIRRTLDGEGFDLWTRHQVANQGWSPVPFFSFADDIAAAEEEIFAQVIAAGWDRHPQVLTDEEYTEMMAEWSGHL